MTTSKLNWGLFIRVNDMQIPLLQLLPSLMLLSDAFKDHIGSARLVEGDHLKLLAGCEFDHLGEESLADLALEFGEVIGDCDVVELSLDLAVYPVLQAAHVNELAGAFAFAGTDQGVLLARLLTEADLAGPRECLSPHLMDVLIELQVACFLQGSRPFAVPDFDCEVLNASEFDVAADFCLREEVHRG